MSPFGQNNQHVDALTLYTSQCPTQAPSQCKIYTFAQFIKNGFYCLRFKGVKVAINTKTINIYLFNIYLTIIAGKEQE